jgi:hypothetical protein
VGVMHTTLATKVAQHTTSRNASHFSSLCFRRQQQKIVNVAAKEGIYMRSMPFWTRARNFIATHFGPVRAVLVALVAAVGALYLARPRYERE